ncbi:DUF1674 domain-containing protein [Arboricoccus pini]|uniref:DUF1674 domain-containing protein n=1 Tax=Arboricoccus pini TaxID=1963835 RepID=UPI000B50E3CC|nr:DUF1674 domain-containing protein [Arboricoccus pini]
MRTSNEAEPSKGADDDEADAIAKERAAERRGPVQPAGEVDGPPGPEPTRFGDWEKGGRCSDF